MSKMKLITKKFQLSSEKEAFELVKELNAGKYTSIQMGTAVVSRCRQTKKLSKMIAKHKLEEFMPSDYDEAEILKAV